MESTSWISSELLLNSLLSISIASLGYEVAFPARITQVSFFSSFGTIRAVIRSPGFTLMSVSNESILYDFFETISTICGILRSTTSKSENNVLFFTVHKVFFEKALALRSQEKSQRVSRLFHPAQKYGH